jgi:hypothetical protein
VLSSATFNIYFTRVPTFLRGYVFDSISVSVSVTGRGNPRVVDFSVQRGVIGRAEDNKFRLTLDMSYGVVDFAESYGVKLSVKYNRYSADMSISKPRLCFPNDAGIWVGVDSCFGFDECGGDERYGV